MTEEEALDIVENSEITRLRRMKGDHRLWFQSPFSTWLLEVDYERYPGLWPDFLESKHRKSYEEEGGRWDEYKLLLRGHKFEDTCDYHSRLMSSLGKFLSIIPQDRFEIETMGIEGIDCSEPDSYYILIYFLTKPYDDNRKESIQEKENS